MGGDFKDDVGPIKCATMWVCGWMDDDDMDPDIAPNTYDDMDTDI